MGSAQSSVTSQTIRDFNNFANSAVNNTYNSSINTCTSQNSLSITSGVFPNGNACYFTLEGGTLNISQTASGNCNFDNQNTTRILTNFKNDLKNLLTQFINQDLQNKQGWFAVAFSLQIADASNTEEVVNQITNNISDNVTNICQNQINANNQGFVVLCGDYKDATINLQQNAFLTATTSCINEVVLQQFTSNSTLNELAEKTNQKLASEQSGIGSLFWWIVVVVAILAVVMIIGLILYFVFSGSGKKPQEFIPTGPAGVICEARATKAGLTGETKNKFIQECSVLEQNILNQRQASGLGTSGTYGTGLGGLGTGLGGLGTGTYGTGLGGLGTGTYGTGLGGGLGTSGLPPF